ncbi:hypothetical protein HQN85_14805 [Pedobacter boryungensis]|uniref:AraC family transcriptional regulator n=2 Tax=Pedobacter boryungensis TaxID=869962 RepID=A0ABX2DG15_9SPHI|nr:hypothetical protein [Pedobacter boryungensis]
MQNEIFVHAKNIRQLKNCCETTSYRILSTIKQTYGITGTKKVTVDHVCHFFGITVAQYRESQKIAKKEE